MLREMYSDKDDKDRQPRFVSVMIGLGSILVVIIIWGIWWQPLKPTPSVVFAAMPAMGSLALAVLGFLRAWDIGSRKMLAVWQFMQFCPLASLNLPTSWKLVAGLVTTIAPFVGYGVGQLSRRLSEKAA